MLAFRWSQPKSWDPYLWNPALSQGRSSLFSVPFTPGSYIFYLLSFRLELAWERNASNVEKTHPHIPFFALLCWASSGVCEMGSDFSPCVPGQKEVVDKIFTEALERLHQGSCCHLKNTSVLRRDQLLPNCEVAVGGLGRGLWQATPGPWASVQSPSLLTVQPLHVHEPACVKSSAGIVLWTCPNGTELCSMRTWCFWIIVDERERNRIICRCLRFLN